MTRAERVQAEIDRMEREGKTTGEIVAYVNREADIENRKIAACFRLQKMMGGVTA